MVDDYQKWRLIIWEEYKEKTSFEWKFSYALWGCLLSIASVILGNNVALEKIVIEPILQLLAFLLMIAIHFLFLYWIHSRLKEYRIELIEIDKAIRKELKLSVKKTNKMKVQWLGQVSPFIQIIITIMLCLLVSLVLH